MMLDWLVERKIAPHIPVIDQSGRRDGTWARAEHEDTPQVARDIAKTKQYVVSMRFGKRSRYSSPTSNAYSDRVASDYEAR
jgi:hypothetical protein